MITNKKFIENYKTSLKDLSKKFRNKSIKAILDKEWDQLKKDRENYRE